MQATRCRLAHVDALGSHRARSEEAPEIDPDCPSRITTLQWQAAALVRTHVRRVRARTTTELRPAVPDGGSVTKLRRRPRRRRRGTRPPLDAAQTVAPLLHLEQNRYRLGAAVPASCGGGGLGRPGRPGGQAGACPRGRARRARGGSRSLKASWICRTRRVRCASRTVGSSPRLAWPSRPALTTRGPAGRGVLTGDGVVRRERFSDRPAAAPRPGTLTPRTGATQR